MPLAPQQRRFLGGLLLLASTISWCAVPIIAFLDIPTAQKVAWAGMSYGFSVVSGWACLPLLGPELLVHGRRLWQRLRTVLHLPAGRDR